VNHHPQVHHTKNGTPYLREPGVVLLSVPSVQLAGLSGFLSGFDADLGFMDYVTDPVDLPSAEELCKLAGQLCYLSFGPSRTKNAEAEKYFQNILASGHGSVLEHANFTFLVYGIDRACTHEWVRHRAGWAYSQVSQRYVDGSALRFVERPSFAADPELHRMFEERIDREAREYDDIAARLQEVRKEELAAMPKRDARKLVNQDARSCLTNETEAPLIVTANVRAWRHFAEMRAAKSADVGIRRPAVMVAQSLREQAPLFFGEYEPDGDALKGAHRKV
jgi:thymidylate synthase (FAD)